MVVVIANNLMCGYKYDTYELGLCLYTRDSMSGVTGEYSAQTYDTIGCDYGCYSVYSYPLIRFTTRSKDGKTVDTFIMEGYDPLEDEHKSIKINVREIQILECYAKAFCHYIMHKCQMRDFKDVELHIINIADEYKDFLRTLQDPYMLKSIDIDYPTFPGLFAFDGIDPYYIEELNIEACYRKTEAESFIRSLEEKLIQNG